MSTSTRSRNLPASRGSVPPQPAMTPQQQQQIQDQLNQLVADVRTLEAYYQEIVTRQQAVSASLMDMRAALEGIDTLSKSDNAELLVPLGGGALVPATSGKVERIIVSVGAGVAVEKSVEAAKTFLQARSQDLQSAFTSLETQRKEIGSRLEAGRATLQRVTGSG